MSSYFFSRDHLGSIREVIDQTRKVLARYSYDPYGARILVEGTLEVDFGFTGHYFHAASGLHLAPFRAYSSVLGRWLNRDPIEEAGGMNLYAYAAGDPVNKWDRDGLFVDTVMDIASIVYDLYRLATDSCNRRENWKSLGLDIAGAVLPGVTGLGALSRVANKADEAIDAAKSGPATWNEFQAATRGQFATRAEAGQAWAAYKDAHGIVTGSIRSMAARSEYLRSLADNPNTASWMKPWLQEGRVPPGHVVDHIKPLSIRGADTPANMRLQGADLHNIHHRYYRPWE